MKFDTIIRGGTVIDGEGSPGRRSDIGVAGGRIAAIADLSDAVHNAPTVIEVHGHIVCPGFIDIHTHSDLTLVDHPDGESKAYQGVTTEVIGNCGFSWFPTEDDVPAEGGLAGEQTWNDLAGYTKTVRSQGVSINIAH